MTADTGMRIEVVRFGELEPTEACATRTGWTLAQIASLKAHPYGEPADPTAVTLQRDGRVVSRIGLFPGRMEVAGERFRISWGSGWGFDGDPRNRAGVGLLLMRAVREAKAMAGCGISESALPIYKAAGFDLTALQRHVLLLRSRVVIERRLRSEAAARLLAVPLDPALAIARRALSLRGARARSAYEVREVERFGEEVARIDALARGERHFPRDATELNWALSHPWLGADDHHAYQALHVRDGAGVVVGYALARVRRYAEGAGYRNLTLASVLRLAVDPRAPGALGALLAAVVSGGARAGVDGVELCTAQPALHEAASALGFVRAGDLRVGMKLSGDAARAVRAANATLASFYLELGEGDLLFG